ncbi:hypothetical protein NL676_011801 [Syzygium grande]|nr:hypothetical protein NL676_011801 [Syzygium grande]
MPEPTRRPTPRRNRAVGSSISPSSPGRRRRRSSIHPTRGGCGWGCRRPDRDEIRGRRRIPKEVVLVTGGTGFIASWMIMRLLQQGYTVRTTVRPRSDPGIPGSKKDISFLTNLPGASENLHIFDADLNEPDSFKPAVDGCTGVFHVAHPMDWIGKDPEEVVVQRSIRGTLGILGACLKSKTVKRVIYTSSAAAIMFSGNGEDMVDESSWSDVEYYKSLLLFGNSYMAAKTRTEKAAIEFAEEKGLDLVTVIPSVVVGPFLCPGAPGSEARHCIEG